MLVFLVISYAVTDFVLDPQGFLVSSAVAIIECQLRGETADLGHAVIALLYEAYFEPA